MIEMAASAAQGAQGAASAAQGAQGIPMAGGNLLTALTGEQDKTNASSKEEQPASGQQQQQPAKKGKHWNSTHWQEANLNPQANQQQAQQQAQQQQQQQPAQEETQEETSTPKIEGALSRYGGDNAPQSIFAAGNEQRTVYKK